MAGAREANPQGERGARRAYDRAGCCLAMSPWRWRVGDRRPVRRQGVRVARIPGGESWHQEGATHGGPQLFNRRVRCVDIGCAKFLQGRRGKVAVERDVEENKNLAVEAFETIEMTKAAVESKCPGVVTCGGILKGRKDSRVSLPHKVKPNLPRPNSTVDNLIRLFASKGLANQDLVAVSDAHTIGFSHCDQFVSRLNDYRGTALPPTTQSTHASSKRCPCTSCSRFGSNAVVVVVPFDVQTSLSFDHMYYNNLEVKMGLLATDQALFMGSRRPRPPVQELGKDKVKFFAAFVAGMDKMGSIRVERGRTGEIRKVCSKHLGAS
ncbi:peroxidase 19 [Canna indica]|uniref:Peroxidase n=1 Tax=Canna indica TaxID=4628 RepID=A0AAQ3JRX0_9LILI|nr:peroxidase 19 [Canna indica]